jgi:hypothetical protein
MGGSKTQSPQACHELEGICQLCGCNADSEVQELVGLDCSFRMCQCNDMQLLWHQACIEKYLRGHKLERYSRLIRVPGFSSNALSKPTSITPLTLSHHAPLPTGTSAVVSPAQEVMASWAQQSFQSSVVVW